MKLDRAMSQLTHRQTGRGPASHQSPDGGGGIPEIFPYWAAPLSEVVDRHGAA